MGSEKVIIRICAVYCGILVLAVLLLYWAKGPQRNLFLAGGFGMLLLVTAMNPLYLNWVVQDPIAQFEFSPGRFGAGSEIIGKKTAFEGYIDAQPFGVHFKKAVTLPPGYYNKAAPGYGMFRLSSSGFQNGFDMFVYYKLDNELVAKAVASYFENRHQKYRISGTIVPGRPIDLRFTADINVFLGEQIEPFDPSKSLLADRMRRWLRGQPF